MRLQCAELIFGVNLLARSLLGSLIKRLASLVEAEKVVLIGIDIKRLSYYQSLFLLQRSAWLIGQIPSSKRIRPLRIATRFNSVYIML